MDRIRELNSFEREMLNIKMRINLFSVLMIYLYTLFLSGKFDFVSSLLNHQLFKLSQEVKDELPLFSLVALILAVIIQVLAGTIIHHYTSADLSLEIELEKEKTSEANFVNNEDAKIFRTLIIKKIARYPLKCAVEQGLLLFAQGLFMVISIFVMFELSTERCVLVFAGMTFTVMQSSLFSYVKTENSCAKFTALLADYGISDRIIKEENFWGIKLYSRIILHVFFPAIATFTTAALFTKVGVTENLDWNTNIIYLGIILAINVLMDLYIAFYFRVLVSKNILKVNTLLKSLEKIKNPDWKKILSSEKVPLAFTTEIDYSIYLINQIILELLQSEEKSRMHFEEVTEKNKQLFADTQKFKDIAENEKLRSYDFIELIKSSVSNLEGSAQEISEISKNSAETFNCVLRSTKILKEDNAKIKEILFADRQTIKEINLLGKEIDSIFDIVATIEQISEQTRAIAFNAELETSEAEENALKFHIITNEIRRFADAITQSILEIKERLKDIQSASDNLIISSEAGIQRIEKADTFIENLNEHFDEMQLSSEITQDCTNYLLQSVKKQTLGFTEISKNLALLGRNSNFYADFLKKISFGTNQISSFCKDIEATKDSDATFDARFEATKEESL